MPEEAVGELAGGTYKKLGIAAGRTLSELLKSGYVYYRVDISEFIQGKTDNLTNVKVISHVHSIRGDGTCACGESFTASVSSGASVDWYKTLSEALGRSQDPLCRRAGRRPVYRQAVSGRGGGCKHQRRQVHAGPQRP